MPSANSVRRLLVAAVATATAAVGIVVFAAPVEAAVVRPFTLNYNQEVYGDFLQAGNGNSACPVVGSPTDPFGEPIATCATAQARTYTAAAGINDSYYMRWADVDSNAATYNSSTASITVPTGARVDFARLNWSGDTGTIRLADGTVSALPGCNTRQFLAGAGTSVLPSGTPESTSVRLSLGAGASAAIAPQVISRDALATVPASQPQFYTAYADVTARFAGFTTGTPQTITLGNVWTPQGFGCYSGWSLVVVYAYDEPNANAPGKREVFVYDGHVRQSSVDPATTITPSGFRVGTTGVRVGVTAFEGDYNIQGDQFAVNGTLVAEPLSGSATTNFFVANAQRTLTPAVPNNMSVDSKEFTTALVPVGATSATMTFTTAGDTYLAENLVLSVPAPSLNVTKDLVGTGPFRPGQPVTYQVTVISPGGSGAAGVTVSDPLVGDCTRSLGTLAADVPVTYTCTGPAPADDFTSTVTASGSNAFGDPVSDSDSVNVVVVNPAVDITKSADQASYTPGQTITFTLSVTNTGDTPLTNVAVSDPITPACASTTPSLAAGGSFTYTCTATAPILGDANTASVVATDPLGGTVTDSATAPAPTLGSVTGRVIADRNNNGAFDAPDGDTGIGGVTVSLVGTTAGGAPVNLTTPTAADGTYTFAGVAGGTYTVTETQPAAFDQGITTPGTNAAPAGGDAVTVTVTPGQSSTGTTFAERPTSSLAGSVYVDANNDGSRDGSEAGIGGVQVTLTGADDAGNPVTLTATTAPDGTYTFAALRAGTYTVSETQPAGYLDGTDTPGSSGGAPTPPDSLTAVSVAARTTATGYLFGEFVAGSLSGEVVDDGGNGIPNATVTLTGPGGPLTTTTAPDGSYGFTGLVPGTYTLTETQPAGYGDGPETVGSAGGDASVNDVISGIVLSSASVATGYSFAEDRGSLAGVVFDDTDNNGSQDGGEPGVGGVPVTLTGTDAAGSPVTTVLTTAPDGTYTFTDLVGGGYTVTESQPAGYVDGVDTAGTSGGTPVPPDSITGISLAGGADATGYTFAEYRAASISGTVLDDGGNGVPGVVLTLTDVGGNPVGGPVVTDSAGTYSFPGLAPGTYTITETQPAGYGDGPDTAGSAGGDVSVNDVISGIVLSSGTNATGYSFAEDRGSLAGVVFDDSDNDGVRDPGEPGIGGVTVALTGTDALGNPVNTVVTSAADGTYAFTDLVGGSYTVTETQPAGYADGTDAAGTAGGLVAPPDSITAITLGGGVDATGYTFGEFVAPSLSGTVLDDGGNGVPGVTLTLTDGSGNPVGGPVLTDASGAYTFPGLAPGTYTITETQPAGYGDGPDTAGTAGGDVSVNDVISGIVLSSGTNATGYSFAEDRGSLAGVVFDDFDNDGAQDAGETGVGGVPVTLTGTDALGNPVSLTTTTGPDGTYVFTDLLGGGYTVTETQPAGYVDGIDTAGTSGGTPTPPDSITEIGLAGGVDATGYTFGEYRAAGISGAVLDDGGNGIPGVAVSLFDLGGNPVAGPVLTDPAGAYSFPGLAPGTYTLSETQPAGYGDGPETAGSAGGDTSVNDTVSGIVLVSGTNATGYLFAEDRGSLAGVVFQDTNNNGSQDPGEAGVGGVPVTLTGTDAAGSPVTTVVTTAPDGTYTFTDLVGGGYTVTETQPVGFLDGIDAAGTSGGAPTPPDSITEIGLAGGVDATGYTFGELLASSVAGRVVDDGGNPIGGVTITLTGTDDLGNPVALTTTTTGADGTYALAGLRPGTYAVTETQPAGYGDGPETAGSAGGDTSVNDVISGIVLTSGTDATGYQFAEDRGSLAGVVFDDFDNNGVQDPGEPGIGGAPVTLTGTDAAGSPVTTVVTTAPDGTYTFTDLVGGGYTVTETQPVGFLDGIDTAGTSGGTPTPPDSITEIGLAGGVDATGYTFGEYRAASIAGTVVDDAGAGIPGTTVVLTGPNGPITTTTGPDGAYSFQNLAPGSHTVTETQPAGYADGPETAGSAGGDVTVNDVISGITLVSGTTATGYTFAEARGSVAGAVYVDSDNDGARDAGEPGIGGVTVTLTGTDALGRLVTATATSQSDGSYLIAGVVGGNYTLTEAQPAGYADGLDAVGTAGGTLAPPDAVTEIQLDGGEAATGYLYGELAGAVSGTVFVDFDSDGTIDTDEPGRLGGVTVILRDAAGGELDRTTTDTDGAYLFPNRPEGTYTVEEVQPAGYGSTTPNSVPVTLTPGSGSTVDFGDQRGLIGDFVWDDTDGDGIQDAGEPGTAGVVVVLVDEEGTEVDRTTTDSDGAYRFTDLVEGTYTVGLELPDGKVLTRPAVEGDDVNSDLDWVTGLSDPVTITLTDDRITQRSDVDAGLVPERLDYSVGIDRDKPVVAIGDEVVITATVTNSGTVPIEGAQATITVPAGLTLIAPTTRALWTCAVVGQTATCTTPALILPGETATPITLTATATAPVTRSDIVATVELADGSSDGITGNNRATISIEVLAQPAPPTTPPATAPPAAGPRPKPPLAWTGADLWPVLTGGLLLLLFGGAFLLAGKRKRGGHTED